MNLLVTGGCGFIGRNLIARLLEGGAQIKVIDNLSTCKENPFTSEVSVKVADINDDKAMNEVISGVDAIIHLAAYGNVVNSVDDPASNFQMNVEGTFNVLEAARRNNIKKFIFASTGGALMGNTQPPVNEKSLPKPISPYGASKLCGEAYCSAYSSAYEMNIIALRFANVVGPDSPHKVGVVNTFIKNLVEGKPLTIYGDGSSTRDYLYVDDLCDGIINALNFDVKGFQQFHLASGKEIKISEVAEIISKVAGKPSHPINYKPARQGEVESNFADYTLAYDRLSFSPKTSFEEAIRATWDWYIKSNNASV